MQDLVSSAQGARDKDLSAVLCGLSDNKAIATQWAEWFVRPPGRGQLNPV